MRTDTIRRAHARRNPRQTKQAVTVGAVQGLAHPEQLPRTLAVDARARPGRQAAIGARATLHGSSLLRTIQPGSTLATPAICPHRSRDAISSDGNRIGAWLYQRAQSSAQIERSIAILPFENRSEDKANAYFAEGIQDEILTRLSKIADLKVISRTSTQHYKSAPENLAEIGKQLGVADILEGSVQRSGDGVRVNVQLIKAANDSHLWADTFDRKLTDIF